MKRIAITGGGTGGHLVIAKALKEAALKAGLEVVYIGSDYGQDRAWFESDREFTSRYFFDTSGVVNKKGLKKIAALWSIFRAFLRARKILKKEKIEALISVGGYSAAPASLAAISRRIPFFIHEQNASVGRLNALLKPFAKAFFSSYAENAANYPVREAFFATRRERSKVGTVIFLGGSQGAKAINELALALAPALDKKGIKIIHQCGKNHLDTMHASYGKLGVDAELFAFTDDMAGMMQKADFAIARSGASTVWETTAAQLPALFIPFPYAAKDHQAANAKEHVARHAAWMMREGEIDTSKILAIIEEGVADQSRNLQKLLQPNGAETIIARVLEHGKR